MVHHDDCYISINTLDYDGSGCHNTQLLAFVNLFCMDSTFLHFYLLKTPFCPSHWNNVCYIMITVDRGLLWMINEQPVKTKIFLSINSLTVVSPMSKSSLSRSAYLQ